MTVPGLVTRRYARNKRLDRDCSNRATSQAGREGDRSWLDQRRADVEFDDLVCGERNAAWVDVVTVSVEENRYRRPGGTGGEVWSARAYDQTQVIGEGARVTVYAIEGATALVYTLEQ
jgi:hypothetical protein